MCILTLTEKKLSRWMYFSFLLLKYSALPRVSVKFQVCIVSIHLNRPYAALYFLLGTFSSFAFLLIQTLVSWLSRCKSAYTFSIWSLDKPFICQLLNFTWKCPITLLSPFQPKPQIMCKQKTAINNFILFFSFPCYIMADWMHLSVFSIENKAYLTSNYYCI